MHKVVLHGAFRDHLPPRLKRGIELDFSRVMECLNGLEQHLPIKTLLDEMGGEFRIGDSVSRSRRITLDELVLGDFKGVDGDASIKLHILPCSDGSGVTTAMVVKALVTAAISMAASAAINLLMPIDQPSNNTDSRKNTIYAGGLNIQKEGVALPYVAGDNVLCGMNVIEGGVTTLNTGKLALRFVPGSGANTNGHGGGGGLFNPPRGGGSGGGVFSTDDIFPGEGVGYDDLVNQVHGAGGGSKGGRTMANTMWSSNRVRFLGAVGIGPMGGLVGNTLAEKLSNVFIDEIPLMRADGTPSRQGVDIDTRPGEPGQTNIAIVPGVESNFDDALELRAKNVSGQAVTLPRQTSTNTKVDAVRVRMSFILVDTNNSKGDQSETSCTIRVTTNRSGQSPVHYGDFVVSGKSSEQCQFDLPISAPPVASGGLETDPWVFTLSRVTPDSTSDKLQNASYFQGWTEVQFQDLTYDGSTGCPPTALFAIAILNESYGAADIPEVASRWKGYKCRVHHNYNAVTKTHTGVSTGETVRQVTSNPAYHLWSLGTLALGGGGLPDQWFDKFNILECAKFCDEQVGGRPRFTIQKQFTEQEVTVDLLRDLAQTFRCFLYWDGQQYRLVPDRPGQVVSDYINNGGVVGGVFKPNSVDFNNRVNEVVVEWDNPADFGRKALTSYRDEAAIAALEASGMPDAGVVRKRVYKIGCTNEAEAYDWARYLVYCAQNEFETMSFDLLLGATGYEPGQLIAITDYNLSREAKQSRILEVVDANWLRLDAPVLMTAGKAHTLWVQTATGLVKKSMNSVSSTGPTDLVRVNNHGLEEGLMARPVRNDGVQPVLYRIVNIQETGTSQYTVTAQLHDEGKYAFLDEAEDAPPWEWTEQPRTVLDPPEDIFFTRNDVWSDVLGSSHELNISWQPVANAAAYVLEGQRPSGTMEVLQTSPGTTFKLTNCAAGIYVFSVKTINIAGATGLPRVEAYDLNYDGSPGDLAPAPVFTGCA